MSTRQVTQRDTSTGPEKCSRRFIRLQYTLPFIGLQSFQIFTTKISHFYIKYRARPSSEKNVNLSRQILMKIFD